MVLPNLRLIVSKTSAPASFPPSSIANSSFLQLGHLYSLSLVILIDKRLRVIPGRFEERTADIFLNTIERVVVQQGIVGRMIAFGTVTLRDHNGTVHRWKNFAQPTDCLWKLQELLGQGREHGG